MKDKFEPSINDLDLSFIGEEKSNLTSNENEDLSFNGNNVMNEGMPMQVYLSRPVVEPFDKFKKSLLDLGVEEGHSNAFGSVGANFCKKHPNNFMCKSQDEVNRNKKKVRNAAKKIAKGTFLTFNPIVAIPRSSALLCFRVNLFGISTRLYPAFLSDEELKTHNFDIANAANAKKAWEKVANFWEDKLGGDRQKLKEAISGAWNKPVFKTKKSQANKRQTNNFIGDDEYANAAGADDIGVGAYISIGATVVSAILGVVTAVGAKKNPYNAGSPQATQFAAQTQAAGTPPPVNQVQMDKITAAAKADMDKGLGLDSPTEEEIEAAKAAMDAAAVVADPNATPAQKAAAQKTALDAKLASANSRKILGMPKPLAIGVFAVLGLAVLGIVFWKMKGKGTAPVSV